MWPYSLVGSPLDARCFRMISDRSASPQGDNPHASLSHTSHAPTHYLFSTHKASPPISSELPSIGAVSERMTTPTENSPLLPTHNPPRQSNGNGSAQSPRPTRIQSPHRRWRVPPPPPEPAPPKPRIRSLDLVIIEGSG
jgi:hypothetical protein